MFLSARWMHRIILSNSLFLYEHVCSIPMETLCCNRAAWNTGWRWYHSVDFSWDQNSVRASQEIKPNCISSFFVSHSKHTTNFSKQTQVGCLSAYTLHVRILCRYSWETPGLPVRRFIRSTGLNLKNDPTISWGRSMEWWPIVGRSPQPSSYHIGISILGIVKVNWEITRFNNYNVNSPTWRPGHSNCCGKAFPRVHMFSKSLFAGAVKETTGYSSNKLFETMVLERSARAQH